MQASQPAGALVAVAVAAPAQAMGSGTGKTHAGKHQRYHANYRATRTAPARAAAVGGPNYGWTDERYGPPGFGAPVAAGVAVGTAGAIATEPFRAANAYDNGYYGPGYYSYYGAGWNGGTWDQGYSSRNGMVCTPGTLFKGDDGRMRPCQ